MARRGELIPDAETAVFIIQSGSRIMHEKAILSAAQVKTWKLAKIIETVAARKLFAVVG